MFFKLFVAAINCHYEARGHKFLRVMRAKIQELVCTKCTLGPWLKVGFLLVYILKPLGEAGKLKGIIDVGMLAVT